MIQWAWNGKGLVTEDNEQNGSVGDQRGKNTWQNEGELELDKDSNVRERGPREETQFKSGDAFFLPVCHLHEVNDAEPTITQVVGRNHATKELFHEVGSCPPDHHLGTLQDCCPLPLPEISRWAWMLCRIHCEAIHHHPHERAPLHHQLW